MDFKRLAVVELSEYADHRFALDTLPDAIKEERCRLSSLRSSMEDLGGTTRNSGSRGGETKMLNSMARLSLLEDNLKTTRSHCARVEAALERLTEVERAVLEESIIYHNREWLEVLASRLCYQKTALYNIRGLALKKFAASYWGRDDKRCIELLNRLDAEPDESETL